MYISHIKLSNWKNFKNVDTDLNERMFLVGPNASGKSNFLDVFRFFHDIVRSGGGLQKALEDRGGLSKIRCLSARQTPGIEIEFHLKDEGKNKDEWKYTLGVRKEPAGLHRTLISREEVWKNNEPILKRPDEEDKADDMRLTQTYLQQINSNADFREIYNHFNSVLYLHIIPQILRLPDNFRGVNVSKDEDSYGFHFLEKAMETTEKTRERRLKKIEEALKIAVPQLNKLSITRDEKGIPHLEAIYEHWRARGAKQKEDQFSDGTLRLIGLLWALLENKNLILLEEPELSLHAEIVNKIPNIMYKINKQKSKKQQLIISTHSYDLLSDKSIGGEEVLLLIPETEGTSVNAASAIKEINDLLSEGFSVAEAVLPYTKPKDIEHWEQMENFK